MEIIITILVLVAIIAGLLFVNRRSASKRSGCGGGGSSEREKGKPLPPKDSKNKENN